MHASRENRAACGEDATLCTYCEDESMSLKAGRYTLRHAKVDSSSKSLDFKRKVGHAESGRVYLPLPPGQSAVSSKEKIALRER